MPEPEFLSGYHVTKAVIDTAVKWGETYVAATERMFGIAPHTIPVPERGQFTISANEFEKWPEQQTPAILVMAPGLGGEPHREADRSLTAPVAVGLFIIVATPHGVEANREAAEILAAAYGQLFLRQPVEGIQTAGIDYRDERYGEVPGDAGRTLGAARVVFNIWVRNWRTLKRGALSVTEPPDDPYEVPGDLPRVESVFPTITPVRRIEP